MGNRITRTVLFAASALLSVSAFGAGAARFGTLRNADWVVTNAWQAVSNKTHDLIIDLGQEASLPPNWSNVSNAAMSAVQSLQPAYDYSDSAIQNFSLTNSVLSGGPYLKTSFEGATVGYSYSPGGEIVFNPSGIYVAGYSYLTQVSIISENTNGPLSSIQQYGGRFLTARQEMENYISTNNAAFVAAVLAAPLAGADADDLAEIAEYGSYGTVGAAILALIAGLAALKRRMTAAETAIDGKADADALPYALVVPGEWTYSGSGYDPSNTYRMSWDTEQAEWNLEYYTGDVENPWHFVETKQGEQDDLVVDFDNNVITATRASLPGHLCDRAVNAVAVSTDTTLTLPAANPGHARDLLVRLEISGSTVPTISFAAPTGETITYETDGDEFPVPDETGTWLYSFTETAAGTFAVALKSVSVVTQGGV